MNKVFPSVEAALEGIPDGAVIGFGGFFSAGKPMFLTQALTRKPVKNITVVVQSFGVGAEEMLDLVRNGQVKKAICNYPLPRSASKGNQHPFEQAVRNGKIELEVHPMGNFVEKMRCAGAGIPAFYTPVGAGTLVAEGKEVRVFHGRETILEEALPLDYAFIHAHKADSEGNLIYRKTSQNYNAVMAMAARITIAEVEYLVPVGELDPACIGTPGIFVQRVVEVGRVKITPGID